MGNLHWLTVFLIGIGVGIVLTYTVSWLADYLDGPRFQK
jgi:hypothetical protein